MQEKKDFFRFLGESNKKQDSILLKYRKSIGSLKDFSNQTNFFQSLYVPIKLLPTHISTEEKVGGIEIEIAFKKYKHIFIVGDPGTGKTTLLKYLTDKSNQGYLATTEIPILISLRNIEKASSFEDEIQKVISTYTNEQLNDLKNLLSRGKFLLLLDGLDEVSIDRYDTVINEIANFSLFYPENPVVITSRIQEDRLSSIFTSFHIASLSDSDLKQFINLYLEARDSDKLWNALISNTSLYTTAKNPLILYLLLQTYITSGKLPVSNRHLAETISQMIVSKTESELSEIAKEFAGNLAIFLTETRRPIFNLDILRINFVENRDEIVRIFRELFDKGVIVSSDNQNFRFAHLLIQNYFASQIIKKYPTDIFVSLLEERINNDAWEQIFILSIEQKPDPIPILESIIRLNSPEACLLGTKLALKLTDDNSSIRKYSVKRCIDLLDVPNLVEDTNFTLKLASVLASADDKGTKDYCLQKLHTSRTSLTSAFLVYILTHQGITNELTERVTLKCLYDENVIVRSQACRILGIKNSKQSLDLLIDTLRNEINDYVKKQIINSIDQIDEIEKKLTPVSTTRLISMLEELKLSDNAELRESSKRLITSIFTKLHNKEG